jgi:hypothetical protein
MRDARRDSGMSAASDIIRLSENQLIANPAMSVQKRWPWRAVQYRTQGRQMSAESIAARRLAMP